MKPWLSEAGARLAGAASRLRALRDRVAPALRLALASVRVAGPSVVIGLSLLVLLALAVMSVVTYTALELHRFARAEARRTTLIYAAGQSLAPGVSVEAIDLAGTLRRLRYVETTAVPSAPAQFRRTAAAWDLYVRAVADDERRAPAHVHLDLQNGRLTRITRDGEVVPALTLEPEILTSGADRPGEEYHPVRLGEMPLTLLHAVLATEDDRFFEHGGLDLRGVVRAAWRNLRAGRVAQGGSTITQQLVKHRLVGSRRTFGRKLREAWLAAVVEWRYEKEEILEAYLNETYLGQRGALAIRGVGAAARAYFRKEVHQLTLGEAALIAGMLRAPNSYSPVLSPGRAQRRRDRVLARMRESGRISMADWEAARQEPIRVHPTAAPGQWAPYFLDSVRQQIEERVHDPFARSGRIFTTLDLSLQRFAEGAAARGLARLENRHPRLKRRDPADRLQAAIVVLQPGTGHVLALVGGRDYTVSQFNRVVLARRQPGSAFKPIVYAAALHPWQGGPAFTAASFIDDSPLILKVRGKPWSPRNYEDRYEGRVSVRQALERSLNAATVRIAQEVGLPRVIETARSLGIASALQPVPALALGAFEVTPLELAGAYLPLANGGVRPRVRMVRAVPNGNGAAFDPPTSDAPRAVSAAEAYLMTSLLEGVMMTGTGASARSLGVTARVAGKTGTTNDGRDAWFIGYTPNLVALVWVGFDSGEPHGLSGSEAALPIWADFMRQALEAYPAAPFSVPAGITHTEIDPTNGKRATPYCSIAVREVFLAGTEPPACEEHSDVPEQLVDWWRRFRDWLGR